MSMTLFVTYLVAAGAAAATGALFKPGDWYLSLAKPRWTPPGWLFPVVWSILYISMSIAAARLAALSGTGQALAFWSVQIAFNTLWTPIFFGLHRIRAAMIVIVGLWLSVAATTISFALHDVTAGLLMAPYLLWVTIAACLNFSIIQLNPSPDPVSA